MKASGSFSIFRGKELTTKAQRHKGRIMKASGSFTSLWGKELTTKTERHKGRIMKASGSFTSLWGKRINHKGTKAQRKKYEGRFNNMNGFVQLKTC
jgi:hypothetical protein